MSPVCLCAVDLAPLWRNCTCSSALYWPVDSVDQFPVPQSSNRVVFHDVVTMFYVLFRFGGWKCESKSHWANPKFLLSLHARLHGAPQRGRKTVIPVWAEPKCWWATGHIFEQCCGHAVSCLSCLVENCPQLPRLRSVERQLMLIGSDWFWYRYTYIYLSIHLSIYNRKRRQSLWNDEMNM
jgi:hypothetical protein